jgi:UDP-N-acetylmuramoylalanine--D-glutamate ligase
MLSPNDLRGLRTVIVGAAREGTALARYLVHAGARVVLSDSKPREALLKPLSDLEGLPIEFALGCSELDLSGVDVLFLSPGVPPWAKVVQQAREQGVPISSEPRLFTQLCAAPIVGITGSSGKTTTTSMVGLMYARDGKQTWVGGNIGKPLIEDLLGGGQPDVAVMELSSFQLELFAPDYQGAQVEQRRTAASRVVSVEGYSPRIAAVTNITPNHLDRHPSMEDYARAKTHILEYQTGDDWAVLNKDNHLTRELARTTVRGRLLQFSLESDVDQGAFLQSERLMLRFDGRERLLCSAGEVQLRGRHNLGNTLTAACCALAGGVSVEAIREVATTFGGVPHRQENVRVWRDVLFVNDSIATSPERALAALRSYSEPLILLAGGRDKHLSWDEWADCVLKRARVVVAFGEAVPIIQRALVEARERAGVTNGNSVQYCAAESLEEAVSLAARLAQPGDVVLLSPGGTSFDAFADFEERGQRFRELVAALS